VTLSIQNLLENLIGGLPRYAEEEGDYFGLERSQLIDLLCEGSGVERVVAENTVMLCEALLDTLSLLRRDDLAKGEWCFMSFPAQLMGTSILTAMSDTDSRFFAANFWNTQGIASDRKDQQREVLRLIEQARFDHHARKFARAIRYCYVAWGIIKLDDRILFYQREDTKKRFEKTSGDYGLIGGRANQEDVLGIPNRAQLLKELQSPGSQIIKSALPETLKRELREEAGLLFETHYTFTPWRRLQPFRQVQGAAPNHALTEYYLDLFQINLTLEGFLCLQKRITNDDRLAWFTLADIGRGATNDGKIPYVRALYDDFGGDRAELVAALSALPDSFSPAYISEKENYSVILPVDPREPVSVGRLGKDKPMDLEFGERRLALILGLAAHLREFEFSSQEDVIVFHPHGWVEVTEDSSILTELIALADFLSRSDLPIENHRDILFRLSIAPHTIYFADKLFAFSVDRDDFNGIQNKIPVTIERKSFDTAFGPIKKKAETFILTLEFAHKLKTLSERPFSADNDDAISYHPHSGWYDEGPQRGPMPYERV
jgi:8-oxo-dGTP pyrophosphatase MutT (NUDIX family)